MGGAQGGRGPTSGEPPAVQVERAARLRVDGGARALEFGGLRGRVERDSADGEEADDGDDDEEMRQPQSRIGGRGAARALAAMPRPRRRPASTSNYSVNLARSVISIVAFTRHFAPTPPDDDVAGGAAAQICASDFGRAPGGAARAAGGAHRILGAMASRDAAKRRCDQRSSSMKTKITHDFRENSLQIDLLCYPVYLATAASPASPRPSSP